MKMSDIKGLDASGIDAKVEELRKEIFGLKMEASTTGLEKPHQIKVAKKTIARLLTAKNEKSGK